MKDEVFKLFKDLEEAKEHFIEYLENNFEFLNYQIQSDIHEVDINRFEIRKCIVFEMGITALTMLGITLEEFLKTLLKFNSFKYSFDENSNLSTVAKDSKKAESDFGSMTLHNAIEKSLNEKIITKAEFDRLMDFKKFIRNAFVHSDKSKMFDDNEIKVDMVELKEGNFSKVENGAYTMTELFFAQGLGKKIAAEKSAKVIYENIDKLFIEISNRFWENYQNPKS